MIRNPIALYFYNAYLASYLSGAGVANMTAVYVQVYQQLYYAHSRALTWRHRVWIDAVLEAIRLQARDAASREMAL